MSVRDGYLRQWYEKLKEQDPHHCKAWTNGEITVEEYTFETFAHSSLAKSGVDTMMSMISQMAEMVLMEEEIVKELRKYVSMPQGETIIGGIRNLAQIAYANEKAYDWDGHITEAAQDISNIFAQFREAEMVNVSKTEIEHIIRKRLVGSVS